MGELLDRDTLSKLSQPFRSDQVRWKPQVVSDNGNALAVAYVDPRVVSERLDEAAGGDWSFHWEPLGVQGDRLVVKSSLTVMGVTREDVGEYVLSDREQADPWKSAVSDALKRAAVHFGVGRYLYWLEATWCAYDRRKREFIDEPYIDSEGHVRVRRRKPEGAAGGEPRQRDQSRSERAPARGQRSAASESRSTENGRSGTPARVREAQTGELYGASWAGDLRTWTARYLTHRHLAASDADDVLTWLSANGELQADLSGYAALSDAQAAIMRGLPSYVAAHGGAQGDGGDQGEPGE